MISTARLGAAGDPAAVQRGIAVDLAAVEGGRAEQVLDAAARIRGAVAVHLAAVQGQDAAGPGARIGISDVVAEDYLTPADRAAAGSYVGCIAGALSRREYLDGLTAAGFADASVTFTTEAAPGMHSAIIRAVKPAAG